MGEVDSMIRSVAERVVKDQFRPEVIVGILRGGCIPAIHLSHILKVRPFYALGLQTTLSDDIRAKRQSATISDQARPDSVVGKRVLLVDDVTNTGIRFPWPETSCTASPLLSLLLRCWSGIRWPPMVGRKFSPQQLTITRRRLMHGRSFLGAFEASPLSHLIIYFMKIYLAGKVPKGSELGDAPDWRGDYTRALGDIFAILSPEDPALDEAKPILVFGHDCYLIREADAVLVNAYAKLGVGTAQEMLIAKHFRKQLSPCCLKTHTTDDQICVCMPALLLTGYTPLYFATSDAVLEDIQEAQTWLKAYNLAPSQHPPKGIEIIDAAIAAYLQSV
jgi:Phosphoribosyl transferase domain